MAYCFYNGVKLPELPSTAYPYCWIRKNDNTQHYDLVFTKVVGYYDASAGGIVYGANAGTTEIAHYRVAYADAGNADSWENYQTTNTWMALDANRTVMWSNHYIPNGSLTATEMYFDGYEAIPEVAAYQIEKDTVVGIADQVRRLCKTEATMTPAQMESKLGDLNIELTELYVTSTAQDVTYTPEEGYYGFSKVVVGGVDLGGGGGGSVPGGGGSGDDSGDEPFVPPSAGDVSFGFEMVDGEEQVPSGYLIHIDTAGEVTRFKEYPVEYQYQYIYCDRTDSALVMYQTALPMLRIEGDYWVGHSASSSYVRYEYDFETETWTPTARGVSDKPFAIPAICHWMWLNHDMYGKNEGILEMSASEPFTVETEPAKVEKPVEVEEEYTVSGEDLNSIIGIAQKVTGTTKPMTVEEATKALTDYGVRPSAEEEGF